MLFLFANFVPHSHYALAVVVVAFAIWGLLAFWCPVPTNAAALSANALFSAALTNNVCALSCFAYALSLCALAHASH